MNKELSEEDIDRIIEMDWVDRTPFEAIEFQFEMAEKDTAGTSPASLARPLRGRA